MKFLSLAIKILPLATLISGLIGGGARMKPFLDTAKVALTQYEIGEISRLVHAHLEGNGHPPENSVFIEFVRAKFHSQYSVLAREINGDQLHDHSMDIWGEQFKLHYDREGMNIQILSAGPDRKFDSPDDITANISYDDGSSRRMVKKSTASKNREPASVEAQPLGQPEDFGNPDIDKEPVDAYDQIVQEGTDNREPAGDEAHQEAPVDGVDETDAQEEAAEAY